MNNQDQEIKADNNCKSCFCLSWVLFFHLLFTSGIAYAQAHADKSRVGDIQLLLSLEGYELDTHRVDGILGRVTKKSIKDYRKKNNLRTAVNDNELIDDELYNSLYEDTKSKLLLPPTGGEENKDSDNQNSSNESSATGLNSKVIDVSATAIAAIEAAHHSVEESKDFYETFTSIFAVVAVAGTIFGFRSLKDVKKDLRWEIKKEIRQEKIGLANVKNDLQIVKGDAQTSISSLQELQKEYSLIANDLAMKTKSVEEIKEHLETVQNNNIKNAEALALTITAQLTVTMYLLHAETKDAVTKAKLYSSLQAGLVSLNEVVDKYNPTDNMIMALALSNRGTIFHLLTEYKNALNDFERAIKLRPNNGQVLFNAACSACKSNARDKAIDYVNQAIDVNPAKREEALLDDDLKSIWDDIRNNS